MCVFFISSIPTPFLPSIAQYAASCIHFTSGVKNHPLTVIDCLTIFAAQSQPAKVWQEVLRHPQNETQDLLVQKDLNRVP